MGASVRVDSRMAERALAEYADAARSLQGKRLEVGSPLVYAFGIETGYTRQGRLARRAGGAWMLRRAKEQVMPQVGAVIAAALPGGARAVDNAFRRLGTYLVAAARAGTPVVSGRLRASVDVLAGGLGGGLRSLFRGGA